MILVDTHTHLYDEKLTADNGQISRALQAGVHYLMMPNCDSETIGPMLQMADQWPQHCYPMMGLHPTYVKENYKEELALVTEWLTKRKFYGIGEVGLDYHWDTTFKEQQQEALRYQADLALHYNLPLIMHTREAMADCIELIRSKQNGSLTGIFHCFGGTLAEAQAIIELGFYLGIGGVLTYKKSGLAEVLAGVPLDRLVLETDAPYLAPVPFRGKRNESSYLPIIAAELSKVYKIQVDEIARITTENARKLFNV
ncbi:MAG: TatD family deoxyribonuclease [Chitinophagia bacterium]|nr:TatD family deoxyribonuclease [Chitinophagia bacterium]